MCIYLLVSVFNLFKGICSRTSQPDTVKAIMQSLLIWDFFKFPQIFPARKTFHFKNLKSITELDYGDFLFFDDEYKNIDICTNLGK